MLNNKKTKTIIARARIDIDTSNKLNNFCETNKTSMSAIVRKGIELVLNTKMS